MSLTNLEEVVNICDGLIVIGSAIDINPKNYDEQPISEIHKMTEEIDTLEKMITSYEKMAAALGQKQCSNNQLFNEKFEAIVDKLFEGKRR